MQPGFRGDPIQSGGADQRVNRNYPFATTGNAKPRIILATDAVRGDDMLHQSRMVPTAQGTDRKAVSGYCGACAKTLCKRKSSTALNPAWNCQMMASHHRETAYF